MPYNFQYVPKNVATPYWNELDEILHKVQDKVRDDFTFSFHPIGSYQRNMVTYDPKSNIGFDFDINTEVNDEEENYEPDEIKHILMRGIDAFAPRYGYAYCEESTRVLTIKKIDYQHSRIVHSADIAIVYNCSDGRQQYIRYNKEAQIYTWEYQSKGFIQLPEKIKWLKDNKHWNEVREHYLDKKNFNEDPDKHSRSLFAEAVADVCHWYGYHKNSK